MLSMSSIQGFGSQALRPSGAALRPTGFRSVYCPCSDFVGQSTVYFTQPIAIRWALASGSLCLPRLKAKVRDTEKY